VLEGMARLDAKFAGRLAGTPAGVAARDWPEPERFADFLDAYGALLAQDYDWSEDVRRLDMPVMLAYADHDAVSTRHIAEFFALLGGGLEDPGWQDRRLTHVRLAIVPGYSHYDFYAAPELGPAIRKFLSDSLAKPEGGGPPAALPAAQ